MVECWIDQPIKIRPWCDHIWCFDHGHWRLCWTSVRSIPLKRNKIITIMFYRLHTEILEFGKLEKRIVDPTLSQSNYREVGLFLVDIGYCKKT